MATRIVFMGSPEFAVPSLRRLVAAGYQVVAVYTQPDREAGRGRQLRPPPVKLAALARGFPVLQPPSLRRPEAVAELAALRPDVIALAAYGQILRQPVLAIPPKGVLNVHPSLLPRHRGAAPIAAAILAGDGETGVTIMLTDPGMDTGPILSQRALPIEPTDTTGTLTAKLADLGASLLLETLPPWLEGRITPQPQDDSQATYASMIHKEDGLIDWRLPATAIWRQVRAYHPWPGAYTLLDDHLLHIWEAWPLPGEPGPEPGTILPLAEEQRRGIPQRGERAAFGVQTGEGVLAVLTVQRAGRRPLAADDFLRGQRGLLGRRLGQLTAT
ncbi:MAG: methionyl-tRNA formyltransferase [Dehalococcoidia bacterium]